jgi:predicted enzyme related to lactoylglutathione lyase
MEPQVNMIMIPANDTKALRTFYEDGLAWTSWGAPGSSSYKVGTSVLVFVNAKYLAAESGLPALVAPKAIMAVFVASKVEVDRQMSRAVKAGGKISSPVRDRDGGPYSGYFTDPEGNGWKIVWSPTMPLDEQGALTFPKVR